jgi:septal ring factor EnvC (AmiA/AmiB activator)
MTTESPTLQLGPPDFQTLKHPSIMSNFSKNPAEINYSFLIHAVILDARHLWGNYHPAMGLKAQIDKLDGTNSELRGQIRKARLEEDKLMNQIQRSKAKISSLEKELTELKDAQMVQQPAPMMQTGTNKELRIALPR